MLNIPHICVQYPQDMARCCLSQLVDLPVQRLQVRRLCVGQASGAKEQRVVSSRVKERPGRSEVGIHTVIEEERVFVRVVEKQRASITLAREDLVHNAMRMHLFGDILSSNSTHILVEQYQWGSYLISCLSCHAHSSLLIVKELNTSVVLPTDRYDHHLQHLLTDVFQELIEDLLLTRTEKDLFKNSVDNIVHSVQLYPELRNKIDDNFFQVNYTLLQYLQISQYFQRNAQFINGH